MFLTVVKFKRVDRKKILMFLGSLGRSLSESPALQKNLIFITTNDIFDLQQNGRSGPANFARASPFTAVFSRLAPEFKPYHPPPFHV